MKVYSENDEDFNYTDVGSLFDDMASVGNLVVGQEYYEADAVDIKHEDYIDAYSILEQLDNEVADDIGDELYANEYTSVSTQEKQELETLILEWAKKYVNLKYYKIKGKTRKMFVTEEDII